MSLPFRLTAGTLIERFYPGGPGKWTLLAGGSDCQQPDGKAWPFKLCWAKFEDPHGRVWIEWFNSYFGVRVAMPRDIDAVWGFRKRR